MYCSDALQKAGTALYANILVILGFALPLSEVISVHISEGKIDSKRLIIIKIIICIPESF
jgi:hypothetical protein